MAKKTTPEYRSRKKAGKAIATRLADDGEEFIKFDHLDAAIVGYGKQHGGQICLIYSGRRIVDALMVENNMEYEDAVEWYGHNVECLYAGPGTPIIMDDFNNEG